MYIHSLYTMNGLMIWLVNFDFAPLSSSRHSEFLFFLTAHLYKTLSQSEFNYSPITILPFSLIHRFSHYNQVTVKVFEGLTPWEVLQVGSRFLQEQQLLSDDLPSLGAKVDVCRRLLYALHELEEENEPPKVVSPDWRVQAAAAIGFVASSRRVGIFFSVQLLL